MSFFEERLPDCYSFGARGGPVFSTEVVKSVAGQRFANKNWSFPLGRWDISSGVKTPTDFEVIRTFFYNVAGQFDGFRFKDWADFQATGNALGVISLGTSYQLQRVYTRGARTFARPIYKPVSSKVTVYRTRSGVTSVISPSVSYTTGVVAITGHVSGDTYTWSGEFDVPVVFAGDQLEAEIVNRGPGLGLLVQWPSIQLEEIRL